MVVKNCAYLRALLDVHTLAEPEVNQSLLDDLLQDEMIELAGLGKNAWRTTPKGAAWIDTILHVPLPIQRWVQP